MGEQDDKTLPPGATLVRPDVAAAEQTLVRDEEQTLTPGDATLVPGAASSDDEGPVTPEQSGRYTIKHEYGRGGQSRVLLAMDAHIGREIALKELLPDPQPGDTPKSQTAAAASRFLREARITGQLEHPNIVPVYEVGRHPDGTLYYTQKLVRGETMKKALARATTLEARLKLLPHFTAICHAVAYAHSRGVIHRDLKPENVMVGEFGETVVLDWGLAKARGQKDVRANEVARESLAMRSPDATLAGHALGTPSYMSPEQAQGKLEEIDEKSDVWSLGAMLYEMLAGVPPFDGDTAYSVIGKVIKDPVLPVKQRIRGAPPELCAVAERALSRERAQRYATARELAEEVEAWQSGRNVRAYAYSSLELLRRFVQRNKALSAVSAAAFVLILAALVLVAREYRAAHRSMEEAHAALGVARANLAQAFLEKAHSAEHDSLWHRAEVDYAAARVQDDRDEARWGAAVDWGDAAPITRFPGHAGFVSGVSFSADGKSVASAGYDSTLRIWDVESGRELRRLRAPPELLAVSWSPDGKSIAAANHDDAVIIWDAATGDELARLAGKARAWRIVWSPDGKLLAVAGGNGVTQVWDVAARKLAAPAGRGQAVAFSPDGKTLAIAEVEKTVHFWDCATQRETAHLDAEGGRVAAVAFSPDGALFATAGTDRVVHLFEAHLLTPVGALSGHLASIQRLDFSHDGALLASSSAGERAVRVFDVKTREQVARLTRPAPIYDLDFAPSGDKLAVAERQTAVLIWDLSSRFQGHTGTVQAIALSPDGASIASAGDRTIRTWDLRSGKELHRIDAGSGFAHLVWNGTSLAAGGDGIALFDPATGAHQGTLAHPSGVAALAAGPDGLLASGGHDGSLRIWRASKPAVLEGGHRSEVTNLAFSPDGSTLFSSSEDLTTAAWDAASGKRLWSHPMASGALAVSTDGKTLYAGANDELRFLDPVTGAQRSAVLDPGNGITTIAVHPGGRVLATGGQDGSIRLRDAATGRVLAATVLPEVDFTAGLAFASNGETLAFLAPGSARSSRTFHLVQLGKPELLPPPEEHLAKALAEHGLELQGMELVLAAPGKAIGHEAAAGAVSAPLPGPAPAR